MDKISGTHDSSYADESQVNGSTKLRTSEKLYLG